MKELIQRLQFNIAGSRIFSATNAGFGVTWVPRTGLIKKEPRIPFEPIYHKLVIVHLELKCKCLDIKVSQFSQPEESFIDSLYTLTDTLCILNIQRTTNLKQRYISYKENEQEYYHSFVHENCVSVPPIQPLIDTHYISLYVYMLLVCVKLFVFIL